MYMESKPQRKTLTLLSNMAFADGRRFLAVRSFKNFSAWHKIIVTVD